ncbi:hypothetical protein CARUB_v10004689mg [Capsella rubella]|uniref:J domain-containing protein n=1 Tax=Capsella rubella TaxID=81985 RepID=R0GI83_9BRAS|nr:uncharacterized protein LOC17880326 [Capsella rubella]EOA16529.1 hypothetical protein CARUB_v10004689mg [Capsella rubella]
MESNKEEARRALDIADRKLSKNDYHGAKKIAIKAHELYPTLEGLEQVLMMIDVYISASNKINGDADWYGILGVVDPLADDEAVKKRYKKLALLLHPDKNRFNGAEGAFKLVSEAWHLLSDKAKRIAYDRKKRSNQTGQKPVKRHEPTSYPYRSVFKPYRDRPEPKHEREKPKHKPERKKPEPEPETKTRPATKTETDTKPKPKPKPKAEHESSLEKMNDGTFWTLCSSKRCKTYWEHKRDYLNKTLTCQNCMKDLIATEIISEAHIGRPVIIMSPCNQPMSKSTSDTFSNSASNSANANAAPIRMKRWFDPLDSSPNKRLSNIFWTVCNRCKTLCKLLRDDSLNKTLACPYCSEDFHAAEIIPNIVNGRPFFYSGQSSSKNTSSDASSTTTSASASAKPKTAYQSGGIANVLKRVFPESREKIAADFAVAAAGGNANLAKRIYKKMTTGFKNSVLETETLFEEPVTTGNENSNLEAERLFKKPMTT